MWSGRSTKGHAWERIRKVKRKVLPRDAPSGDLREESQYSEPEDELSEQDRLVKELRADLERSKQTVARQDDQIQDAASLLSKRNEKIEHLEAMRWSEKRESDDKITQMRARHRGTIEDMKVDRQHAELKLGQTHDAEMKRHHDFLTDKHAAEQRQAQETAERTLRDQLSWQHNSLSQTHASVLQQQRQAADTAYQQLIEQTEANVQRLRDEMALEKASILQNHDRQLRSRDQQLSKLQLEHEDALALIKNEVRDLEQGHADEIESLNKSNADSIAELKAQWAKSDEEQLLKQDQMFKGLRLRERQLNDALLASDDSKYIGSTFTINHLPQNPDSQLRDQFLELHQSVEDLGRLTWKDDRQIWTDQLLAGAGKRTGSRLVKKAIVQDMIWAVLYRLVFCSPFCMLGEEGSKLHKEWVEQCQTADSPSETEEPICKWPAPSTKAERWRYMTMSECCAILGGPPKPSEYDKRSRVQEGFKASLKQLIAGLRTALSEIAILSGSDMQMIQRLATSVSNIWFNLCMHRCRIVVRHAAESRAMKTSAEVAAQVQQGKGVELVVFPKVGRYGNVKGVDLETFTSIEGCRGEILRLPE